MEPLSTPRHVYVCCHKTPAIEISTSFDFPRFIAALEDSRHRPLCGLPVAASASFATAWIHDPNDDWLVYPHSGSPARDIQLMLHQAAHMILDHAGLSLGSPELARLLFRGLEDELTRHFPPGACLSCGVAVGEEERQAITLARDIAQRGEAALEARAEPAA